eukprot:4255996-Pleurochrysis_carterae.AAC.2
MSEGGRREKAFSQSDSSLGRELVAQAVRHLRGRLADAGDGADGRVCRLRQLLQRGHQPRGLGASVTLGWYASRGEEETEEMRAEWKRVCKKSRCISKNVLHGASQSIFNKLRDLKFFFDQIAQSSNFLFANAAEECAWTMRAASKEPSACVSSEATKEKLRPRARSQTLCPDGPLLLAPH